MADPRTINIPGNGQAAQQYALAPGLLQYVQAVYAVIDNSAGAAARPTLTVSEQSGVVIAKKRQGEAIPAAGNGSATWALRLDDELAGLIRFDVENVGDWLHVTANGSAVPQSGTIVLDAENANPVTGGRVTLYAGGVFGIIQLFSENSIDIRADGDCEFRVDGNYNCSLGTWQGAADIWQMNFGEAALEFFGDATFGASPAGTANFFFQLRSGGKLEVLNELGDPIFRINEDGSLQGKTGKALTFNL